ncbi:hypothetical protein M8818_007463 [Zalaria obscura]|uniref:Uncharacterized protein n=1 Tax=Zalaria obscura TaxID=2024903 RepID=A0ACC3S530_9PEZI
MAKNKMLIAIPAAVCPLIKVFIPKITSGESVAEMSSSAPQASSSKDKKAQKGHIYSPGQLEENARAFLKGTKNPMEGDKSLPGTPTRAPAAPPTSPEDLVRSLGKGVGELRSPSSTATVGEWTSPGRSTRRPLARPRALPGSSGRSLAPYGGQYGGQSIDAVLAGGRAAGKFSLAPADDPFSSPPAVAGPSTAVAGPSGQQGQSMGVEETALAGGLVNLRGLSGQVTAQQSYISRLEEKMNQMQAEMQRMRAQLEMTAGVAFARPRAMLEGSSVISSSRSAGALSSMQNEPAGPTGPYMGPSEPTPTRGVQQYSNLISPTAARGWAQPTYGPPPPQFTLSPPAAPAPQATMQEVLATLFSSVEQWVINFATLPFAGPPERTTDLNVLLKLCLDATIGKTSTLQNGREILTRLIESNARRYLLAAVVNQLLVQFTIGDEFMKDRGGKVANDYAHLIEDRNAAIKNGLMDVTLRQGYNLKVADHAFRIAREPGFFQWMYARSETITSRIFTSMNVMVPEASLTAARASMAKICRAAFEISQRMQEEEHEWTCQWRRYGDWLSVGNIVMRNTDLTPEDVQAQERQIALCITPLVWQKTFINKPTGRLVHKANVLVSRRRSERE